MKKGIGIDIVKINRFREKNMIQMKHSIKKIYKT